MFIKKNKTIVTIEGMMCDKCASSVESALKTIEEVSKVKVSLKDKSAIIISNKEIPIDVIKQKIKEIDYSVTDIKVV